MRIPGRRYQSRISEACSSVGDPYATYKHVEDDCLFGFQYTRLNVAKEDLGSIGEKCN